MFVERGDLLCEQNLDLRPQRRDVCTRRWPRRPGVRADRVGEKSILVVSHGLD